LLKAVLFDFDGVIANTLDYHVQAWQTVFSPYNINISPMDIAPEEGATSFVISQRIAEKKQLHFSLELLELLAKQKRKLYGAITKATIYPEILEFINKLKNKSLKLGLVTGSIMESILSVVDNNFLQNFQVIITSEYVLKNKPHPEPYLAAAQKLNVQPAECLVIENAPLGIKAAKQAGMKCTAVRKTIHDDSLLSQADQIVDDVSLINIDLLFLTE